MKPILTKFWRLCMKDYSPSITLIIKDDKLSLNNISYAQRLEALCMLMFV